jgi:hypothetical protein
MPINTLECSCNSLTYDEGFLGFQSLYVFLSLLCPLLLQTQGHMSITPCPAFYMTMEVRPLSTAIDQAALLLKVLACTLDDRPRSLPPAAPPWPAGTPAQCRWTWPSYAPPTLSPRQPAIAMQTVTNAMSRIPLPYLPSNQHQGKHLTGIQLTISTHLFPLQLHHSLIFGLELTLLDSLHAQGYRAPRQCKYGC